MLRHDDLDAVNSADDPNLVAPVPLPGVDIDGERVTVTLPAASWSVVRLQAGRT